MNEITMGQVGVHLMAFSMVTVLLVVLGTMCRLIKKNNSNIYLITTMGIGFIGVIMMTVFETVQLHFI